jgi:hypothetical protein
MKTNVGSADRIARMVLGVFLIAVGFYFGSWWGVIGFGPIIIGLLNYCPTYSLIGVSTKSKIDTEKLKVK